MKKNNFIENVRDFFIIIGRALKNAFVRAFFGTHKELSMLEEEAVESPLKGATRKFFKNKLAIIGLIVFLAIFAFCFVGSIFIKDKEYRYLNITQRNISPGYQMMAVPKGLQENGILDIAVGSKYSAGIDLDNNVYLWGQDINNLVEDFPQGQAAPSDLKVGRDAIAGLKAKRVWAGQTHFMFEKMDGTLEGIGIRTDIVSFGLTAVPTAVLSGAVLVNIAQQIQLDGGVLDMVLFNQINLVITKKNRVFMWGNTVGRTTNFSAVNALKPVQAGFSRSNITFLYEDGTVGVIGEGSLKNTLPAGLSGIVQIVTTAGSALALKADGTFITWGDNLSKEFEYDDSIQGRIKKLSKSALGSDNYQHFTAVLDDGSVYSWGSNQYNASTPPKKLAEGTEAANVFSGYFQNYVIDEEGKLLGTYGLKGHLFGTDDYGRDLLDRVMGGGRISLTIGLIAVIISTTIGIIIGGTAGFYGGRVDILLMRFSEVVGSIPFLPIAMTFSAILSRTNPDMTTTDRMVMIMIILGVLSWTGLAYLIRATILSEREKEFVTAAKALGVKNRAIIFRHIIPNVLTIIIISATLGYASSLLTEAGLSFLGFGVQLPAPSWGNLLTGAQEMTVIKVYWWRWVFPSVLLCLATISINLIGDAIRDAVDPRSSER
ncbi:MAG: ABC transporter permease subunit [Bacilli bacterium]|jgi:peptide/nickel transport system permease protein|nr:ABC transporter permease subunit [Bacilli bacterium]MDY0063686.1 ABC transporter permease subunit [Bacilli bacterium]